MLNDLINQIATLMAWWDKVAVHCHASDNSEENLPPEQKAFLIGMALGMETAREELSAVLAKALTDGMKLSPTLM